MYVKGAIFNLEVINNLFGNKNSVQFDVRGATSSKCLFRQNCHSRDGFCSLQGECI